MATEKENLDSGSYDPSDGEGRGVPRGENRICKEAKSVRHGRPIQGRNHVIAQAQASGSALRAVAGGMWLVRGLPPAR